MNCKRHGEAEEIVRALAIPDPTHLESVTVAQHRWNLARRHCCLSDSAVLDPDAPKAGISAIRIAVAMQAAAVGAVMRQDQRSVPSHWATVVSAMTLHAETAIRPAASAHSIA